VKQSRCLLRLTVAVPVLAVLFRSQGYMTGGGVLNVMFAALMGSFSLGLVGGCSVLYHCWLLLLLVLFVMSDSSQMLA
jgi:hypothetical protein